MTLCYKLSTKKGEKLANSRLFPLNGPAHLSAYIEIEQQYHFNAVYDDSNAGKRSLQLTFDTPESQEKRKVVLKFEGAIQPKAYLSAAVESPYKSGRAEIGVTNDDKELVLYGEANSDAVHYLVKLGFKKGGSGTRREYTPIIEFNNPDTIPYKVSGKVIADSSQAPKVKYIFEKLAIEPAHKDGKFGPLVLDGTFEHEKVERFETAMDVKYRELAATIKGKVLAKQNELDLDLSLLTDVNELANGRVKLHLKRSEKQCKNSFVFVYGRDLESTTKRIELTTDYEFETHEDKLTSLKGKNTLIISPVPVKIVVNGGFQKNHFDYEFLAECHKNKLSSNLLADVSRKSQGDWHMKFDGNYNNHGFELETTRDIDDAAQKSNVKHVLKSSFGTDIVLKAKFDNVYNAQKADVVADGTIILARGQKPLKLDFKLAVTPKSSQTTGKLLADNNEFLSFNAVLNRSGGDANAPTTGTFDLTVQEFVVAHGDYNSLKGVGKSEFVVTFPKFDRKVKVDTKYEVAANKFDLRNDFYYDFEKDNTRHISFDTKNKFERNQADKSFHSVNEVDLNGEKFHIELDGDKSGDLKNGKQNMKFLLRLPTQREIAGSLERKFDLTSPKATGHGNFKLSDTTTQGGRKTRSIELHVTLKEGNRQLGFYDLAHKLTLTDFDGKSVIIDTQAKHLPKGEFKTALGSVKVHGSVPHPVELLVAIDEYCEVHAVYNANFKYGNAASVHLNGDYAVGEAGKKPATYKLSGKVSVPQSKFKELSFDTRGSLKYPDAKDANGLVDYDFKFNSKLNEKNMEVDTKGKFGRSNGDVSLTVKLPDIDSFAVDLDYKYDHQIELQSHHGEGNVQVRYGNGKNIKFSGDAKVFEGKELALHGTVNMPYEKVKSLELSVKVQKKDENTYLNEAELNIDNKKYKIQNNVVVSQLSPSFTLDVFYPTDKHSQIAVQVNRVHDRKYKLKLRLLNINNFQLTSDAELSFQNIENFALLLDLDSAAMKANKVHVDVHTMQNGNNKGIEFSATADDKNIVSGSADYAIRQEKGKTTIEGKGNVNWYEKSNALTYKLVQNTFTQIENNETGVSVSNQLILCRFSFNP